VIGVDVYEGNATIDWDVAIQRGNVGFVGVRASEGTRPDKNFHLYVQQLNQRKVPWFAYGLLRFEQNGPTPEAQGKVLVDVVSDVAGNNPYQFTPVIDLEFPGGSRARFGITAGQALAWFLRCYVTVKAGLGGADPGVYTSKVVWNDPDGLNGLPCPDIVGAWSWPKYWPYPVGSQAVYNPILVNQLHDPPCAPPFAGNWNVHQYQGDCVNCPGFTTKVDMNRTRVVGQGATGGSVQWIQRKLKITTDGVFGTQTLAAVKAFQQKMKLGVDGLVGYFTSAALSRVV
jgi:GH25 family lysozyme M1 (1,4-beta-N-acetylmuramidase)